MVAIPGGPIVLIMVMVKALVVMARDVVIFGGLGWIGDRILNRKKKGDTMPRVNPGERVGAIESADSLTVRLFGFGTYDGNHPAPNWAPTPGLLSPRITLDNGATVWGFQCWWGPESYIRAWTGERRVDPTVVPPLEAEPAP